MSTFAIAVISTWESVFVVCNIGPDIYQSWGEIVARKWFIRVSIRTATSAQSVATFLLTGLLAHSRNMTESTTRFMKHCTIIRSPSAIRKIHIDKVTKVFQFHSHRGHWSTLDTISFAKFEVSKSRRMPLLGPSPSLKRLLPLSHLGTFKTPC